jgi:hypothetical protein
MKKLIYTAVAMLAATPAFPASSDPTAGSMFVLIMVMIACYFFPSIIAFARGHHQVLPIFLLNLLLGWTVLAWIGALIWSASAITYKRIT